MAIHVTQATEQRLGHHAALDHRTPDHFAQEVFDRFLDRKEHLTAAVEDGRAAVRRGDLHDHEDVMSMLDQIIEG